jgi:carboxymethylenebutenolidase
MHLSFRTSARHAAVTTLGALVALALALLLAVPTPASAQDAIPAGAETALERLDDSPRHGEWVTVPAGNGDEVRAWVVYPERSDPAPVVVVIHEIFGLTDWIRAVADQLAADGYLAIAPDLLSGMGPDGGGTESVDQQGATALIRELERDDAMRRIRASGEFAAALPGASDAIATLGFCWGGTASFDMATLASDLLDAAVVFYGTSSPEEALPGVDIPILGLYGEDDARVNVTIEPAAEALAALGQRFEYEIYPGAGHGFLRQQDGRDGANLAASREAWARTLSFLGEVIPGAR